MTDSRLLGTLGAAAMSARRVGLGRPLNALMDAADALLLRAQAPPLKASFGQLELRGYLRHRGFLDYVARGMREESYYRTLVDAAVDSRTTFVDAGAHIGVYTLLVCRRARRVVAFEPDPYNLAALRRNVQRGGCENVEIRSEAVAKQAGHAEFRAFRSTFSGSLAPREVDSYRTLDVRTTPIDSALEDSDLGSLVVKLDVEGAEPLALAGMRRSIRQAGRLVIFAEVNSEALEAGGSSAELLVGTLLAADMECGWVDEKQRSLMPLRDASRLRKGNVMCEKHRQRQ